MMLRLRELEGLAIPSVDHPLMEAPFDVLLRPMPEPDADDYMKGTTEPCDRKDWPQFEDWGRAGCDQKAGEAVS